ncbi:MAG: M28 family peptidase [Myxococcota bacterium]
MPPLARLALFACIAPLSCGDDLPTIDLNTGSDSSTGAASTGPATTTGADSSTGSGPPCTTDSAEGLLNCVDRDAIVQDVTFVAEIRPPETAHWLAVQELCMDRMEMLGMEVQIHEYSTGINVVGRRPGTTNPEQLVLVGAHYDHIPDCTGADDNATGVAGALEVARVLAPIETERTLAVACWDEEERGLLGSSAWVALGLDEGESVVAYYNYDMIGFASDEPNSQQTPLGFDAIFPEQYQQVQDNEFRGDFILVAADDLAAEPTQAFEAHAAMLGLPTVIAVLTAEQKNNPLFSDLRRSDHAPFWNAEIPAMFFTDSANFRNPAYHCAQGDDTVDALDFDFAADVVAATVGSAAQTLRLP